MEIMEKSNQSDSAKKIMASLTHRDKNQSTSQKKNKGKFLVFRKGNRNNCYFMKQYQKQIVFIKQEKYFYLPFCLIYIVNIQALI